MQLVRGEQSIEMPAECNAESIDKAHTYEFQSFYLLQRGATDDPKFAFTHPPLKYLCFPKKLIVSTLQDFAKTLSPS